MEVTCETSSAKMRSLSIRPSVRGISTEGQKREIHATLSDSLLSDDLTGSLDGH